MKHYIWTGKPGWVFELWALGCGDEICAADKDLPIHPVTRLWWRVRGAVLTLLFDWWRWAEVEIS